MRKGRWVAIGVGIAVAVAASVGWRGSRPISPIADGSADAPVPATGTLSRNDVAPAP
jgi:hypothetical protein